MPKITKQQIVESNTETAIVEVVEMFHAAITQVRGLINKGDSYTRSQLTLTVEVGKDKADFSVQYMQGYGEGSVKAASLDACIVEVLRRHGFKDEQEAQMNLRALPAPKKPVKASRELITDADFEE